MSADPSLRPVRRTSVVEGVIERLREHLERGDPGARLPAERELARRMGVSRPTVREALRSLERMGVVDTRHGSGSQFAYSGEGVLRTPLAFLLALDRPTLGEVHDTRRLIEVHLAGAAAERRTAADLAALEAALQALREGMRARRGYVAPDLRFHKALAAAAHRPILERIMTCLSDSVVALMDAVKPDVHDWDSSYRIHERILGAIRARRPGLARKLMTRHHDMMLDELEEAGLLEQGR